jgi:Ca2+-transporting ATPase
MMFGALLLFMWELQIMKSTIETAMTIAFLVMVFSGLFHTLNAKKLHTTIFTKDFFSNKYLFISIIFSTLVTLLVMFTEYGRTMFGLELIGIYDWILVLGFSFAIIAFSEVIKLSIKSEFQEQTALRGIKNYLE